MYEYEVIVEYSFNPKTELFVVRFLSGESYALKVNELPKKMCTKKPDWERTRLSDDKKAIIFEASGEERQLIAPVIHSKGKLL